MSGDAIGPDMLVQLAEATIGAISLPSGPFLDVACGSGIVARTVRARDARRAISAVDIDPLSLGLTRVDLGAKRIDWREGDALNMPFADGHFSALICQQGLQFFGDDGAAIAEMARVLGPRGLGVITVWSEVSPLAQALSEALKRHANARAAARVLAPFAWAGADTLPATIEANGLRFLRQRTLEVERVLTDPYSDLCRDIGPSDVGRAVFQAGDSVLDLVLEDTLAELKPYRSGKVLKIPHRSHLFVFSARHDV